MSPSERVILGYFCNYQAGPGQMVFFQPGACKLPPNSFRTSMNSLIEQELVVRERPKTPTRSRSAAIRKRSPNSPRRRTSADRHDCSRRPPVPLRAAVLSRSGLRLSPAQGCNSLPLRAATLSRSGLRFSPAQGCDFPPLRAAISTRNRVRAAGRPQRPNRSCNAAANHACIRPAVSARARCMAAWRPAASCPAAPRTPPDCGPAAASGGLSANSTR